MSQFNDIYRWLYNRYLRELYLQYTVCFLFHYGSYNVFALAGHEVSDFMHQRVYECTWNLETQCNCQVVLYKPQWGLSVR